MIRKNTISSPMPKGVSRLRKQGSRAFPVPKSISKAGSVQIIRRLETSHLQSPALSHQGSLGGYTTLSGAGGPPANGSPLPNALVDAGVTWNHRFLHEFAEAGFDPKAYLARSLKSTNEKDIRTLLAHLDKAKQAADAALRRNVYRTYPEFIEIAKEMMKLETDMFLLKDLLSEMKVIGEDLTSDVGKGALSTTATSAATPSGDPTLSSSAATAKLQRRRTLRNSVADQQALFQAQMTSLYNTVEDSQRFLPFHPHRHVVTEYHGLRELNPTTYQFKQSVSLILLNDSLLVAARRKRTKGSKPVLVADKCWALADITLVDLQDTRDLTHAVKIVRQAEVFLFYCGSAEAKRDLVTMGKQAAGAFVDTGGAPGDRKVTAATLGGRAVFVKEDNEDLTAQLERLGDELDVRIAHRDFDAAVKLVEQARRLSPPAADQSHTVQRLTRVIRQRQADLATWIISDLSLPNVPKARVVQGVRWLVRLDQAVEAKNVFLAARSATIRHRARQLKLEGSTELHIRELAIIFFNLIRNTCSWYAECFAEPDMTSGLIRWVREELAVYADIFRRQVFHSLQRLPVIASCLDSTEREMSVLMYSGLDLNFMLEQEFARDLAEVVARCESQCATQVAKAVRHDDFLVLGGGREADPNAEPERWLASSLYAFESAVCEFLREVRCIARETLYGQIIASTSGLVESTLKQLLTLCRDPEASDTKCFAVIINGRLLVQTVIPRLAHEFGQLYHRPAVDFDNLRVRLDTFPRTIQEVFCHRKSQYASTVLYSFATMDFSAPDAIPDTAGPTTPMREVVRELTELGRALDAWAPLDKKAMLGAVIERFFYNLTDPAGWDTAGGRRSFGARGVQQLVLDIHFFLRVAGPWVTKNANSVANKLCEKALRLYFSTHRDRTMAMKTKPWYDARVAETIGAMGPGYPDFGQVG
ncbi:exocyst complex component exo84 [Tieghemiomyces parasiticus]|uniref:Exocyst complex component EXO84 n=1 Tax=Tieghemiomyces parasiticus TaxID=78921 RepID=A0A9W8DS73_9FUNG|nr:exocyst complex component exo84 [Tieghemiomyces parasiticus]